MSARFKPGSRQQDIWEAWEKGGVPAAYAAGKKTTLIPDTIRRWTATWEREKKKGVVPQLRKEAATKPEPGRRVKSSTRPRVRVEWDPKAATVVFAEGSEVSEIEWLERSGDFIAAGHRAYVPNKQWRKT